MISISANKTDDKHTFKKIQVFLKDARKSGYHDGVTAKKIDEFITKLQTIAQIDANGFESWYARDLQSVLAYDTWEDFEKIIRNGIVLCRQSMEKPELHYVQCTRDIPCEGNKNTRVQDWKMTRYACYLATMDADNSKPMIAVAQSYFAIQTRRQDLREQDILTAQDEDKRVRLRQEVREHDKMLSSLLQKLCIGNPVAYMNFQNAGYKGLYGGLDKNALLKHKKLNDKEDLLDYMYSEELSANYFRVIQTLSRMKQREHLTPHEAMEIHYNVGKEIRNIMINKPEDLVKASIKVHATESLIVNNVYKICSLKGICRNVL